MEKGDGLRVPLEPFAALLLRLASCPAEERDSIRNAMYHMCSVHPIDFAVGRDGAAYLVDFSAWGRARAERFRQVASLLRAAVQWEVPAVQAVAAVMLGYGENPEDVPLLIQLLGSADAQVRVASVEGLGILKDERSIEPLLLAATSDPEQTVREQAAWELSFAGKRAVPRLMAMAGSRWARDRAAAVGALGSIGDAEALPLVRSLLSDSDRRVKKAVKSALAQFSSARRKTKPPAKGTLPD